MIKVDIRPGPLGVEPGSVPKANTTILRLPMTHKVRNICHDILRCSCTECSFYPFREHTSFIAQKARCPRQHIPRQVSSSRERKKRHSFVPFAYN